MSALVTDRMNGLADALAGIKVRARTALATEVAQAIGTTVRDLLVVALFDRLALQPSRVSSPPRTGGWRDDDYDRARWGEPRDPWDHTDEYDPRTPERSGSRYDPDDSTPRVPAAVAVAVGITVSRWWLSRCGSVAGALGVGVLTAMLGLAGGPAARAILAVVAAVTDVLAAEATLARPTSI